MKLYYPTDIEAAYESWQANCGPCSLAAVLGKQVNDVRDYLDGFTQRRYMNPTHVKAALDKAGVKYHSIGAKLPDFGLAFIQWGGHEGKPIAVQYRFTHWIAVQRISIDHAVFECNAPHLVPYFNWQEVMCEWSKEEKRGDGTFFVRAGLEVERNL